MLVHLLLSFAVSLRHSFVSATMWIPLDLRHMGLAHDFSCCHAFALVHHYLLCLHVWPLHIWPASRLHCDHGTLDHSEFSRHPDIILPQTLTPPPLAPLSPPPAHSLAAQNPLLA